MSGDRVDAPDVLDVLRTARLGKHAPILDRIDSASRRIAELIEAADRIERGKGGTPSEWSRLKSALRACREGDAK